MSTRITHPHPSDSETGWGSGSEFKEYCARNGLTLNVVSASVI